MRTPGDPPPPGAIVIREGRRKPTEDTVEILADQAVEVSEDGTWDGNYRLSVYGDVRREDETLDEAVLRIFDGRRTVKWYRIAEPATLEDHGFRVGASEPEPFHYDVILGEKLDDAVVDEFEGCFQEARRIGT